MTFRKYSLVMFCVTPQHEIQNRKLNMTDVIVHLPCFLLPPPTPFLASDMMNVLFMMSAPWFSDGSQTHQLITFRSNIHPLTHHQWSGKFTSSLNQGHCQHSPAHPARLPYEITSAISSAASAQVLHLRTIGLQKLILSSCNISAKYWWQSQ